MRCRETATNIAEIPGDDFFPKDLALSGQEASESGRLYCRTILLPAFAVALLASPVSAKADTSCTPARVGAHVAAQPETWRHAVEALVAASATPDQPWGCVGGEVDLVVGAVSATLTVVDAQGHAISREIVSPEEVAPLGEALLAKPLEEPKPPEAPKPVEKTPPPGPTVEAKPAPSPQMLVAASIGLRYAGRSDAIWASAQGLVGFQYRGFGGGIWLRNDSFVPALNKLVPPLDEICGGATAFWAPSLGRLDFRLGVRPSFAIITQRVVRDNRPMQQFPPLPQPQPQPQPQTQQEPFTFRDEKVNDFRMGIEGQVGFGLTKWLRPVMGFDVEITPKRIGSSFEPRSSREMRTRLPAYTIGLALGVEVAFP